MSYFELNKLQIYRFNVFLIFTFINGCYEVIFSVNQERQAFKLKLAQSRTDDIFIA